MQRPLQISFKGMESSPALEALIRRRVGHLERLYPRMTGCRVVVEVTVATDEGPMGPQANSVRLLDRSKTPARD